MPTRRQEKIASFIRKVVSDAIANHLSDPRIESFVSVTRVEVSADMRVANVYLSMFGGTEAAQNKTFAAILHARKRIQSLLAEEIQSRFCPVLNIFRDENFKKTLETLKLIDNIADEFKDKDQGEDEDSVDHKHD